MSGAPFDPPREDPEAPEVLEGRLDRVGVESYFRDLDELAEIDQVLVRWVDTMRESAATTLEESRDAVRSGTAHAVQIRYRYGEETWCDTLLADDKGHRILRVRS